MVVSYLPVEALFALVRATGYDLDGSTPEYQYRWLLERIGMLRDEAKAAAILHDNPKVGDLVALVQSERCWSAGLSSTILALQVELENLRRNNQIKK